MGADLSRVRFDARRDHAGVVLQQGRLLLDARLERAGRDRRTAHPRRGGRPRLPGSDCRHRRRGGRATYDAGCIQGHAGGQCTDDRPGTDVRRRPAGREPRRRARRVRPAAARGAGHAGHAVRQAAVSGPDPPSCRRPAATSPTWTCGSARSRTSRHPTWWTWRSGSTPPRGCRRCGRCGCMPSTMRACPVARSTPTSRAGRR